MDGALDECTEVLAALSLATDLANGHDDEKTLRSCVLAVGLAEAQLRSVAQADDALATPAISRRRRVRMGPETYGPAP